MPPVAEPQGGQADDHLGQQALRGALQAMGGQGAQFIIQLASVVVLARLLTPEDYGLFAMVLAVVGVGHLLRDAGLSTAAIQAQSLSRSQRDNLFWINAGIGALLAGLTAAAAPALGYMYGNPAVVGVTLGYAPTFLLSGMATQYQADLMRRLKIGAVAVANTGSAALALGLGIAVGAQGGGVWSLVVQQLAGGMLGLLFLVGFGRWVPRWFDPDAPMRDLFRFGIPLLGTQLLMYVSSNLDSVVIGRWFGAASLGVYNRALQLVRTSLNQVRGPLGNLSLSVLSRIQSDDERLLRYVRSGSKTLGWPMLVVVGGSIVLAPELVRLALGNGWEGAVVFVRLIALGEGLNTLASAGSWIYTSRGHSRALLRYTLVSVGVRIAAIFVGASLGGVIGVAVAFAVVPVVLWPLSTVWVGRVSSLRTSPLLLDSMRIALTVGAATVLGLYLRNVLPGVLGVVVASCGFVVVLALATIVPQVRRDYSEVAELLRRSIRRRA